MVKPWGGAKSRNDLAVIHKYAVTGILPIKKLVTPYRKNPHFSVSFQGLCQWALGAHDSGRGGDLPLPFRPQLNWQAHGRAGEALPAGGFAASLAKGG